MKYRTVAGTKHVKRFVIDDYVNHAEYRGESEARRAIQKAIEGKEFFDISILALFEVEFEDECFQIYAEIQDMQYQNQGNPKPGIYLINKGAGDTDEFISAVAQKFNVSNQSDIEEIRYAFFKPEYSPGEYISLETEEAELMLETLSEIFEELNMVAEDVYLKFREQISEEEAKLIW